ncbi:mitochondrial ribosomal subunit protein-domain-containing protein [Mycena floridula]|nr:mitochondrial ribosomal subunit protein-domain-containing protein [Mycena floridula]
MASLFRARHFHSTSVIAARRVASTPSATNVKGPREKRGIDTLTVADIDEHLEQPFQDDDTTTAGHEMLRDHRHVLHYLRLIEHEIPKLVAFRRPFVIPTEETPVIVRSIDYNGEPHPATNKRVIVAPIDKLPLSNEAAIHKIKLLAGPRWTIKPPSDAGVSPIEAWGNGYIKISCEDFPTPAMNLKWACETLDIMIREANDPKKDSFSDVPLDMRHIFAKARKANRGENRRGRVQNRPTIHDFPREWLPVTRDPKGRRVAEAEAEEMEEDEEYDDEEEEEEEAERPVYQKY